MPPTQALAVANDAAAKAAWIAKQNKPEPASRGESATTPSSASSATAPPRPKLAPLPPPEPVDDAGAKAAWLAKQRQSTWGLKTDAARQPPPTPAPPPLPTPTRTLDVKPASDATPSKAPPPTAVPPVSALSLAEAAAAKAAWLASQDELARERPAGNAPPRPKLAPLPPPEPVDDAAAKAAWLAKQRQSTSVPKADAAPPSPAPQAAPPLPSKMPPVAAPSLAEQAAAEAAWLAKHGKLPGDSKAGDVPSPLRASAPGGPSAPEKAPTAATPPPATPAAPVIAPRVTAPVAPIVSSPAAVPVVAPAALEEATAKVAWLSRLSKPTWRRAAAALSAAASEAAVLAGLSQECDGGDGEACTLLRREENAKLEWLQRLHNIDVHTWPTAARQLGVAAQAVSELSAAAQSSPSSLFPDAAVRSGWMSQLDPSKWDLAARVMGEVLAEAEDVHSSTASEQPVAKRVFTNSYQDRSALSRASRRQTLNERCASGDDEACTVLTAEGHAKRSWVRKIDLPSWRHAVTTVSQVAGATAATAAETAAKAARRAEAAANTVRRASRAKPVPAAAMPPAPSTRAATRRARRAAAPAAQPPVAPASQPPARDFVVVDETASKAAWLAMQDTSPSEGVAAAASEVAALNEEAKHAWMQQLDVAASEAMAGLDAQAQPAQREPTAPPTDPAAKAAWLAKLDLVASGQADEVLREVTANVELMESLLAQCEAGDDGACEALAREEEAKRAWMAKIDAPAWKQAQIMLREVTANVEEMESLLAQCESGEDAACEVLSQELAAGGEANT